MDFAEILILCLVSFAVGIVSVSTGGGTLIMVPALIWLGMAPKNAVATNMFALVFLSLTGAAGFRKQVKPNHYKMIALFSAITIFSSFTGAKFVVDINAELLKKIIAVMMCVISGFFIFQKDVGTIEKTTAVSKFKFIIGTLLVFILGVYGGFFSGGYVTVLSYVLILTFGFSFLQVAFITKVLNTFSSLAACAFFYYYGLIDFYVGIPLSISMLTGGFLGTKLAVAKGNRWVRDLFIVTVIILAIKLLAF